MSNVQFSLLEVEGQTFALEDNQQLSESQREQAIVNQAEVDAALQAAQNENNIGGRIGMLAEYYATLNKELVDLPDGDPLKEFVASQNNLFKTSGIDDTLAKIKSDEAEIAHDDDMANENCDASPFASMFSLGLSNLGFSIKEKGMKGILAGDESHLQDLESIVSSQLQNHSQNADLSSSAVAASTQDVTRMLSAILQMFSGVVETMEKSGT